MTTYDLAGNVASTENACEQVTTYAWDGLGRLTEIDRPEGENDVSITYQPNWRQRATATAQPEGAQALAPWDQSFAYDDLGFVSRESLLTRYAAQHLLLLDTTFDLQGRPVTIRYPDTQTIVRYEYTGAYLAKVCEVPGLSDTCAHEDAVDLVSQVVYDALGRAKEIHTPAGVQTYIFDADTHRVTHDQFTGATSGSYQRHLEYTARDALGNVLSVDDTNSNGAVEFSGAFAYDSRNRLSSWTKAGTTVHFTFDALGNLTGHEVGTAGATNQTFGDPAHPHRITAASHSGGLGFAYDDDGNLKTQTGAVARHFMFDSQNRLTCVGTSTGTPCNRLEVAYDAEGRRLRERSATSPATESVFLGDLFTLEYRDGSGIDRALVHVFALGREIVRKPITPPTLRSAETFWLLPGPLPELPATAVGLLLVGSLAGVVWIGFVLLPGLTGRPAHPSPARAAAALVLAGLLVQPSVPAKAGGGGGSIFERNWLIADSLGSAQAMVAEDGWLVRETSFKPFGKVDQDVYAANPPKHATFAGHRLEPATDLYYMQARWMNPVTGTFLSVDPVVADAFDPQSANAYSYARNNPVTFTDPTGMFSWESATTPPPISFDTYGGVIAFDPYGGLPWTAYQDGKLIDAVASQFVAGQAHVMWASLVHTGGMPLISPSRYGQAREGSQSGTEIRLDHHDLLVGTHAEAQIINPDPKGQDYRVWGGPEKPASGWRQIWNAVRTAFGGNQFGSVIAGSARVDKGVPPGVVGSTLVRVPLPYEKAVAEAGRYVGLINAAGVRYDALGPNSNTVAYGLSVFLGGPLATPPVSAPGAGPFPFPE